MYPHEFKNMYISERMMGGIERWVEEGILPCNFLQAIISNNLSMAVINADDENLINIPAFVDYFYNHTPNRCWGSVSELAKWKGTKAK